MRICPGRGLSAGVFRPVANARPPANQRSLDPRPFSSVIRGSGGPSTPGTAAAAAASASASAFFVLRDRMKPIHTILNGRRLSGCLRLAAGCYCQLPCAPVAGGITRQRRITRRNASVRQRNVKPSAMFEADVHRESDNDNG